MTRALSGRAMLAIVNEVSISPWFHSLAGAEHQRKGRPASRGRQVDVKRASGIQHRPVHTGSWSTSSGTLLRFHGAKVALVAALLPLYLLICAVAVLRGQLRRHGVCRTMRSLQPAVFSAPKSSTMRAFSCTHVRAQTEGRRTERRRSMSFISTAVCSKSAPRTPVRPHRYGSCVQLVLHAQLEPVGELRNLQPQQHSLLQSLPSSRTSPPAQQALCTCRSAQRTP